MGRALPSPPKTILWELTTTPTPRSFLYDGARLIQITNTSAGDVSDRVTNGNFQPSISDDGRFIAFSSNRNLAGENGDANLEIFVYDTVALSFTQLTNSSGIVGATDAKIQRQTALTWRTSSRQRRDSEHYSQSVVAEPGWYADYSCHRSEFALAGDDLWSRDPATTAYVLFGPPKPQPITTQVFLFDGRNGNITRQVTTLGSRVTEVPLHPTISGDGTRIAFATRRSVAGMGAKLRWRRRTPTPLIFPRVRLGALPM